MKENPDLLAENLLAGVAGHQQQARVDVLRSPLFAHHHQTVAHRIQDHVQESLLGFHHRFLLDQVISASWM
jgi:hypothetical protein